MLEEALQELAGVVVMEEVEAQEAAVVRVGLAVTAAMVARPKLCNTEVCCLPSLLSLSQIMF